MRGTAKSDSDVGSDEYRNPAFAGLNRWLIAKCGLMTASHHANCLIAGLWRCFGQTWHKYLERRAESTNFGCLQ
jgi:hypothetical protein